MIGVIDCYDDGVGYIMGSDNEKYLFLKDDICDDIKIDKGEKVIFTPEVINTFEVSKKVARFVRVLGDENGK